MKGSILGLILTVSAFIILKTINLSLVTPGITPLPGGAGIFYKSGSDLKSAPIEEAAASNIPQGYNSLIYKCSESGGGTGPSLFIWKFPKANFQGNDANYGGVVVVEKTCGQEESLGGIGSFKTTFKTSGAYYFLGAGCSGYMSYSNIGTAQLFEPFKNKIKSVKIVNDLPNDIRFGVIFHQENDPTRGGVCTMPLMQTNDEFCQDVSINASSADIFVWNSQNPDASGDGIEFYSEPFGWQSGAKAGKNILAKDVIKDYWSG
jgi:hypothetical protein